MRLNSLQFIAFAAAVVLAYLAVPVRVRWLVILLASTYFYATWVPVPAVLGLVALLFIAYLVAVAMVRYPARRRPLCGGGLLIILGILVLLKFSGPVATAGFRLMAALGVVNERAQPPHATWILPVGYSFITFTMASYLIDVYRGTLKPAPLSDLAAFVSAFPKILAGPIERAAHFLPQWKERRTFDLARASEGLYLILWGLFKKVVVADRLAPFVDKAFAAPAFATPVDLVVGVYFFAFQIYCDFSGYTDIATGVFKWLGFDLAPNFQRAYLSRSTPEFWGRRWHISLGTWFRDYLYIPLGGSRISRWRTYLNLMVVFTVSGLWHAGLVGSAVSLPFVLWGAINGVYQVASVSTAPLRRRLVEWFPRLARLSAIPGVPILQTIGTFHLIAFGWIFFRASSIPDAWGVMTRISGNIERLPTLLSFYRYRDFEFVTSIVLIGILLLVEIIDERKPVWERLRATPTPARWGYYYLLAAALIILGKWGAARFIYMQF